MRCYFAYNDSRREVNGSLELFQCGDCGSEFVELVGQGVEDFVRPVTSASRTINETIMQFSRDNAAPVNVTVVPLTLQSQDSLDDTNIMNAILGAILGNNARTVRIPQHAVGLNGSMTDILHHILMHEQSHPHSTPASDEAIRRKATEIIINESSSEYIVGECCCITQEPFVDGETALRMHCCEHMFKREAIMQWLSSHNTCPVCRSTIE